MFCHNCGTQVTDDLQYCTNCGQPLAAGAIAPSNAPVPWNPPANIHAQTGRWIGAGWRLVQTEMGSFVLLALVFALLTGIPLISGALAAGVHIYCLKKLMGRRAELSDLFKGFQFFLPTLLASFVIALFTFAGTLLCLIPGLIVAAMYKFTYLFIVDKRMDFWQAMQASHAVARNDYFGFTIFMLAMAGLNLLGVLCCIVGVFVTIPITFAAITIAYQETVGFDPRTADDLA